MWSAVAMLPLWFAHAMLALRSEYNVSACQRGLKRGGLSFFASLRMTMEL